MADRCVRELNRSLVEAGRTAWPRLEALHKPLTLSISLLLLSHLATRYLLLSQTQLSLALQLFSPSAAAARTTPTSALSDHVHLSSRTRAGRILQHSSHHLLTGSHPQRREQESHRRAGHSPVARSAALEDDDA